MEHYFAMGGREYLKTRREWREFGEPDPTLDDTVCGLVSIFETLETGDNDRFYLETIHHSEDEIELILRRGGKIDHSVQYACQTAQMQKEKEQIIVKSGWQKNSQIGINGRCRSKKQQKDRGYNVV